MPHQCLVGLTLVTAVPEEACTSSAPEEDDFLATIKGKYGPAVLYKERRLDKHYSKVCHSDCQVTRVLAMRAGQAACSTCHAACIAPSQPGRTLPLSQELAECSAC